MARAFMGIAASYVQPGLCHCVCAWPVLTIPISDIAIDHNPSSMLIPFVAVALYVRRLTPINVQLQTNNCYNGIAAE